MKQIITLILLVTACYPDEYKYTTFTIPAGKHYSLPRLISYLRDSPLVFLVRFDSSAIYDNGSDDINKLYGAIDCNSLIHENSARIGWRWWDNQLQLFSYTYNSGNREYHYITSVPLDKWIRCEIDFQQDYIFRVEDSEVRSKRTDRCKKGVYLLSYPYVGGDGTINHDVTIKIKEL